MRERLNTERRRIVTDRARFAVFSSTHTYTHTHTYNGIVIKIKNYKNVNCGRAKDFYVAFIIRYYTFTFTAYFSRIYLLRRIYLFTMYSILCRRNYVIRLALSGLWKVARFPFLLRLSDIFVVFALRAMKALNHFRRLPSSKSELLRRYTRRRQARLGGRGREGDYWEKTRVFRADNNRKSNGKRGTDMDHSSIWQRSNDSFISRDDLLCRSQISRDALPESHRDI